MSAAQWVALTLCVIVCGTCAAGVARELWLDGESRLRDAYRGANVAYDDAEVARLVAEEEAAWAEWAAICQVLDIAPDAGTPIYDRLVCDEMERAEGWAS